MLKFQEHITKIFRIEMMASFIINITLLVLGTMGALAAFGGETWKKGDDPLTTRITRRGWIALSCMVVTLALGVVKEVRANALLTDANVRQRKAEDDLANTLENLRETQNDLQKTERN